LFANPVKELKILRSEGKTLKSIPLKPGSPYTPDFQQDLADLEFEIDLGQAKQIVLKLGGVPFTYDVEAKKLQYAIESQRISGNKFSESIPIAPVDNKLSFRILVDRASIEIFLNEGEKAIFISTLLDPENIGFVFESIGGNANINI